MKLGINVPNFGPFADPGSFSSLAREAEQAGWDGVFVWDHMLVWDANVVGDPWILLAGAAAATERVALGPMVTPLPRRRPWKLAREAVSLDHLSEGRLILGVGIGFPADPEFTAFGESGDARARGEMLDEGLEILQGLWTGLPFAHSGRHYHLDQMTFLPTPVRSSIPIWVAGMWPNKKPFRRAARFEGVFPISGRPEMPLLRPADLTGICEYVNLFRSDEDGPIEVVSYADLPDDRRHAEAAVAEWEEAGATWLHVGPGDQGGEPLEAFRARVRRGPPRS